MQSFVQRNLSKTLAKVVPKSQDGVLMKALVWYDHTYEKGTNYEWEWGSSVGLTWNATNTFNLHFDATGTPIVPSLTLPRLDSLFLGGMNEGVIGVEYRYYRAGKTVDIVVGTQNGQTNVGWVSELPHDGLYLSVPSLLRVHEDPTLEGEVRLYYNRVSWPIRVIEMPGRVFLDGIASTYDVYDIRSGNRTDSTVLDLATIHRDGKYSVGLSGWQGKQVVVECSHDLKTWVKQGQVTLDVTGHAEFTPPDQKSPLYIRGFIPVTP